MFVNLWTFIKARRMKKKYWYGLSLPNSYTCTLQIAKIRQQLSFAGSSLRTMVTCTHWIKHLLDQKKFVEVNKPAPRMCWLYAILNNKNKQPSEHTHQDSLRKDQNEHIIQILRITTCMQKPLNLFLFATLCATFIAPLPCLSAESWSVFWVNGCLSCFTKGKNRNYVRIQHDIKKRGLLDCLHGWKWV